MAKTEQPAALLLINEFIEAWGDPVLRTRRDLKRSMPSQKVIIYSPDDPENEFLW